MVKEGAIVVGSTTVEIVFFDFGGEHVVFVFVMMIELGVF